MFPRHMTSFWALIYSAQKRVQTSQNFLEPNSSKNIIFLLRTFFMFWFKISWNFGCFNIRKTQKTHQSILSSAIINSVVQNKPEFFSSKESFSLDFPLLFWGGTKNVCIVVTRKIPLKTVHVSFRKKNFRISKKVFFIHWHQTDAPFKKLVWQVFGEIACKKRPSPFWSLVSVLHR